VTVFSGRRSGPLDRRERLTALGAALAALAVLVFVPGIQPHASAAGNPLADSQGTVTSLPAASGAVTVDGRGQFSNLKISVNQTTNLENQAISVSWTGGVPTDSGPGESAFTTFNENYLQIFECWGDPSPTDPLTPVDKGPSPTQCEFGGESGTPTSSYPIAQTGFQYSRVLASAAWSNFDQVSGYVDSGTNGTGDKFEPFDAVDGTVVNVSAHLNCVANSAVACSFSNNPYFSFNDTNEIDFARTYDDGDGQQLFQVDTGLEAPGLGCGQAVETAADGTQTVPQCWLVIVPRGTAAEENPSNVNASSVVTSPLNPVAWANRISIPLSFKPVGSACALGANEERIVGSELAVSAVSSWQPSLCAQPGTPPFSYSYLSDDQARQDLTQASYGGAGMAVFSDPIDPSQTDPSDPVVYAPLTLSGVVVGFNIERQPALEGTGPQPDEQALAGTQVEHLYLTPLLVAKLLTESYKAQLEDVSADTASAYAWVQHNPTSLLSDPDFLQYNPEFTLLAAGDNGGLDAAALVVEESSSDAASTLWNWVLSDPEADAWLSGASTGEPANGGTMLVNPIYSTNPSVNPSGQAFAPPTPNNYPKSDPYQVDTGQTVQPNGSSSSEPARPIGVLDWSPYALTMQGAAQAAAASNDGGKTTDNQANPPADAWVANGPQESGTSFILSVTDSASAAQYGLQTANLSRAGDDTADRTFIAPDQQGLLAGEQAMVPSSVPGVLAPNPGPTTIQGAYPLTVLTYAATTPVSLAATDRQNFATFLQYAAGAGQVAGVAIGQLPPGYAPLPAALQAQTLAATATILNPPVPSTPPSVSAVQITSPTTPAATVPSPIVSGNEPMTVPTETGSTPSTSGPATVPATVPVTRNAILSTSRTGDFGIGALRWALPIAVLVGVAAGLVSALLLPIRRRRNVTPADSLPTPGVQP
jgi:hypothetical protein